MGGGQISARQSKKKKPAKRGRKQSKTNAGKNKQAKRHGAHRKQGERRGEARGSKQRRRSKEKASEAGKEAKEAGEPQAADLRAPGMSPGRLGRLHAARLKGPVRGAAQCAEGAKVTYGAPSRISAIFGFFPFTQ